jgi:hypothetical protein
MGLIRPSFTSLNTTNVLLSDPIAILHNGQSQANVDIGLLLNRANGLVSNVAIYWNESGNTFVTAFTSNSGLTNSNISVSSYAPLVTGNLTINGTVTVNGTKVVVGPAFSAYPNNNSQSIPTDVQTKVLFQVEDYDTNNNFASSRFTPTVEGYYQLNSTVRLDGSSGTGEMMIVIWKNGSEYRRGTNQSGTQIASNFWAMSVSTLAYANGTTDYFEVYVQHGAGANRTVTAVNAPNITYFNGALFRAA